MQYSRRLNKEQVFQKLKHYCAYQERCKAETIAKAYSFGLNKLVVEELVLRLADEGYLNEERFARQFASGKFKLKQWGKAKIVSELKKKRVSSVSITIALGGMNEKEYLKTLEKLAKKKWDTISGQEVNLFVKMTKTRNYLLQKGYEPALINKELANLSSIKKAP